MAERLTKLEWKQLGVAFREFAEEDHGTVVLLAVSRGVRFALDEGP
jgi:hypothetical protein